MTIVTEEVTQKSGRWIPWMIVGFFVVVAILDGIFVYMATSTHTGVVTKHAYEEGLRYNETVAAADAQAALGWQGDVRFGEADKLLEFSLLDANGESMDGASVRAELTRPTQAGMDFTVPMVQTEGGVYSASLDFPEPGLWDVRIFVEWKQKQYQQTKRLVVAK
ncbi:FixH family protein [Kordiimonas lacus]|uniref:Nitrogen fixation protein FixH n=1 Tax=Kordiimonas lacus TaxID=637679 RepID=A0A1G6ZFR5_9PROT|nr:FixH family protein [Kordiimonas lacus]SDE01193.1 Nitrogen fixation protein FixH [Kordiimonas lacus]